MPRPPKQPPPLRIREILRPEWLQPEFEAAMLYATLAAPSDDPDDVTARQSLVAFCWEVIGFNGGERAFGNRLPPAWEWPKIDQRKFLRAAYRRIDKALVAAHLAMPVLLGRDTVGERGVAGREARIEQAINAEASQREASQKAGYAVPPVRLPPDSDDGRKEASKNVLSRVMRPVRPVLHLAAGLALAIERAEQMIARSLRTPRQWEQVGIRTRIPSVDHPPMPMLQTDAAFLNPLIAMAALTLARDFEDPAWAYIHKGRPKLGEDFHLLRL